MKYKQLLESAEGVTDTFTNELGNSITINVSSGTEGVEISMFGPDSHMTNDITVMEAKTLSRLLSQYLRTVNEVE